MNQDNKLKAYKQLRKLELCLTIKQLQQLRRHLIAIEKEILKDITK